MFHAFKQYIEANCQNNTTALVKIAKETHGDIVVSSRETKLKLINHYGMSTEHVYTCAEINEGAWKGRKISPIFFDTDVIWELISIQQSIKAPVVYAPCSNCGYDGYTKFSEIEKSRKEKLEKITGTAEWRMNKMAEIDGYASKRDQQINVKLTDEDLRDIDNINAHFFEGEASRSMLGRIILRKGIQFYKKLKDNL